MRLIASLLLILIFGSCKKESRKTFTKVEVQLLHEDSISIRALEVVDQTAIWFAGNHGKVGVISKDKVVVHAIKKDSILPAFRSIAYNNENIFVLSIENPALLYRIDMSLSDDKLSPTLVYQENHEKVFYDAMAFWSETEGIAIGDPIDGCLSIIITRDGGNSWQKVSCEVLPKIFEGEAAFAASNGNIALKGEKVWIVTGGKRSRVFYSPDRGISWEVFNTPIVQGSETTGGYSIDFYDENNGIIYGGDYTKPDSNRANKAITVDGGKTWSLIADGETPGYKSCVRYLPNTSGKSLVAVGFTGISFSNDSGNTWKSISDEPFYSIRFLNDSIGYAAGKNRIAKLSFK